MIRAVPVADVEAGGADAPLGDATLGQLLRRRAAGSPETDFVVTEDERLTYAAADRRSRELARGLVAAGAGRGARIALLFPAGIPFVLAYLAAARIGAVTVPLSTFATGAELRAVLSGSDATMLLGATAYRGHDYVAALEEAFPGLDLSRPSAGERFPGAPSLRAFHLDPDPRVHPSRTLEVLEAGGQGIADGLMDALEDDVGPDDRLLIVYTSGSTSAPKGVVHCHADLLRHQHEINRVRGLKAGTTLFSNSPVFWIGGVGANVTAVLVAGATYLCPTSLDAGAVLDMVERERPEMVNGFEHSVARLVADPSFAGRDFSFIRSGNLYSLMPPSRRPADPSLRHAIFGTTETASICLMSADETDQPASRRGSFGRPLADVEARLVQPDGGGDCGPGVQGELWMRGRALMEGYWGRERFEVFTPDQWYRTGDLFTVDADGFFYFQGRLGDMIKTAGANVSPREVEAALREVTGADAVVLGIEDAERGQLVAAVVVAEPQASVDLEALPGLLRARLSSYKVPRRYLRLSREELPTLSSGKPDMRRLAEVLGGA